MAQAKNYYHLCRLAGFKHNSYHRVDLIRESGSPWLLTTAVDYWLRKPFLRCAIVVYFLRGCAADESIKAPLHLLILPSPSIMMDHE